MYMSQYCRVLMDSGFCFYYREDRLFAHWMLYYNSDRYAYYHNYIHGIDHVIT